MLGATIHIAALNSTGIMVTTTSAECLFREQTLGDIGAFVLLNSTVPHCPITVDLGTEIIWGNGDSKKLVTALKHSRNALTVPHPYLWPKGNGT